MRQIIDGRIVDLTPAEEAEILSTRDAVAAERIDLQWIELRAERNRLLAACDFTQLPDWAGDREAWATYRQALRDVPQNTTDPAVPSWPERPS